MASQQKAKEDAKRRRTQYDKFKKTTVNHSVESTPLSERELIEATKDV
ncbi:hypothetical protein ACFOEK_10755 [Litoribrevibacter euphylliae]|uniref:30S ribosomal protein S14 n=1 Tax=Litoribrevibacter euphylliae TaxID=1834034 RepID=A0ABV7HFT8_9GAMM